MGNTNASPVLFGFDFQLNAAIVLMLENIKELKKLRLEGATEDIELTLKDGKIIFAQAKSVVNASSDFSNVRAKASKAIKTLSEADGPNVEKLILITNSRNPLNEKTSSGSFYGPPSDLGYNDLTEGGKKIIDDIVANLGVKFEKNKFRIKFFQFETDNDNERYKVVLQMINDFLAKLNISNNISASELMRIWQNDIFRNGSKTDITIQIKKEGLVWPIIVLAVGKNVPYDLLDSYDQGLADEISAKYSDTINNCTERYEMVSKVLYDYNECRKCLFKLTQKQLTEWFVKENWENYIEELGLSLLDDEIKEGIAKIVISKIVQQRFSINAIKKEVAL